MMEAPVALDAPCKGGDLLSDDQVDQLLRQAEERLSAQDFTPPSTHDRPNHQPEQDLSQQDVSDVKEKLGIRLPQQKQVEFKDNAGSNWFNLPKTALTSELKRDWQILRMRNVLDPKQQRKTLKAEPPKYSQVGEIIAGPTDFYSARLTRKERKQNLLQEAFSERDESKFRNKYAGIQKAKTSGKKAFYKKVVAQRRKNKG